MGLWKSEGEHSVRWHGANSSWNEVALRKGGPSCRLRGWGVYSSGAALVKVLITGGSGVSAVAVLW